MGQRNARTLTGINAGELAEFMTSIHLLAKKTGQTPKAVFQQLSPGMVNGKNGITGTIAGYTYEGDGKMILAHQEVQQFLNSNPDVDRSIIAEQCWEATGKYVADHHGRLPTFDRISNLGGSSNKDDLTLSNQGARVKGISLKWGHSAPEKSQSIAWKNSVEPFYAKFVDMQPMHATYETAYENFSKPAFRISSNKGDYTPDLRARGSELLDTITTLEKHVGDQFISGNIDPDHVAAGYLTTYVGDDGDITLVELYHQNGEPVVQVNEVDMSARQALADKIATAQFAYTQRSSTNKDGESWTRHTDITMNGKPFIHYQTTVSTDRVKTDEEGNVQEHLRRIKRQTYLMLNTDLVASLAGKPGLSQMQEMVTGAGPTVKPVSPFPLPSSIPAAHGVRNTQMAVSAGPLANNTSICRALRPDQCSYHQRLRRQGVKVLTPA